MTGKAGKIFLLWGALCAWGPVMADSAETEMRECLLNALNSASDEDTVGMLREKCASPQEPESTPPAGDLLSRRIAEESEASANRFAILQHKGNYLLPAAYNEKVNQAPFDDAGFGGELEEMEFKFQVSLKVPIMTNLFGGRGRLFGAYTNQSWWQAYNAAESGPFRETNHEPEAFIDFDTDYRLGEWQLPLTRIGLSHQSNGRSGDLSRSWNRAYAQFVAQKGSWAVSFKPWFQILSDNAEIDNPDIDDFMGNFELGIIRKGDTTTSSILVRNNLQSDNKGAFQYEWSRPVYNVKNLRWYLQYFYGYGESLIDYDARVNRLGIGFRLGDWL